MPALAPEAVAALERGGLAALSRTELGIMLRAIASLSQSGDPQIDRVGEDIVCRIEEIMPEARTILALHRHYRPDRRGWCHRPDGGGIDMEALHRACHEARPVSFDYTDLHGNRSSRRVLPLELVHPPHGILLLAHCEMRGAQRKFFTHAIENLVVHQEDFSTRRPALLQAALDEAEDRRWNGDLSG